MNKCILIYLIKHFQNWKKYSGGEGQDSGCNLCTKNAKNCHSVAQRKVSTYK